MMRKCLIPCGNILVLCLRDYIALFLGIDHRYPQVYSDTLVSSDVSWCRDTFGVMHRYSCTQCPISSYDSSKLQNWTFA